MKFRGLGKSRIRLLAVMVVLVGLLFFSRLFFLQVVKSNDYQELADRQYSTPLSQLFDRGAIYFQDKSGALFVAAGLKRGLRLAIKPGLLTEPVKTYETLVKILPNLDRASFLAQAEKVNDPYEEVANHLTLLEGEEIAALNLPGVSLYKERWRDYPGGTLGAHLLGLVAYQGDTYSGRYGLERYYDQLLTRDQNKSFVNFFAEIFSGLGETVTGSHGTTTVGKTGDVVLTIEPRVQHFVEDELKTLMTRYQPESAGVIIIEPKTGRLRALSAVPTFNPGERQKDINVLPNPLVEKVYEMGSILKPLTLAAGLDAGVVNPDSSFIDTGSITLDGYTIKNHDEKIFGRSNLQKILDQSINTGAVFVMQKLGRERFRQYFLGYGLGERTGIDLPGEAANIVGNLNSPRQVEYATAAFGQGVAFSPISMVRALSVLASGGYLVTPHLTDRLEYDNQLTQVHQSLPPPVVLKPETTEQISRLLVAAVDHALSGGRASLPHYSIAAKTGTAQIARSDKRGYYSDRYLHSFFGYFPAYDAKFLVFYYLVYPKGVAYSSDSLTDPFLRTTKFLIDYYEVAPDR